MTNEKILEVISLYEKTVVEELQGSLKLQLLLGHTEEDKEDHASLMHLQGMLPKMRVFVEEGRREKAFRWLGFVQGALWVLGVYTIDELKRHNTPPGEEFQR